MRPVATGITRAAPVTTSESYLGALRADRFANGTIGTGVQDFGAAPSPPPDHLAYGGRWSIGEEAATASIGATLRLNFTAGRVYLVLGSPGRRRDSSSSSTAARSPPPMPATTCAGAGWR